MISCLSILFFLFLLNPRSLLFLGSIPAIVMSLAHPISFSSSVTSTDTVMVIKVQLRINKIDCKYLKNVAKVLEAFFKCFEHFGPKFRWCTANL